MLYSRSKIPHLNLGEGFYKRFFHGKKSLTKIQVRDFTNAFFTVKIPHLNLGEGFSKGFFHGQKSLT
jgi:hypothetical protein